MPSFFFVCGTCAQRPDVGLSWHCPWCIDHHVPISSAHCDRCGTARTPKLPSDPGLDDRITLVPQPAEVA